MFRLDTKYVFFDSKPVISFMEKKERAVLSKFGAFVRRAARSSIRKRKRSSTPGKPPSSHTGLLKKFIFFGYDRNEQSVVIGPVPLGSKSGDAPETLEYGGTAFIEIGPRRNRKTRRVSIEARPYIGPAYEREQSKLSAMWAGSVK